MKEETDPYEGTGLLGFVGVGDKITYRINYRNYLDEPATVTIVDTLDANVAYVDSSDGGQHSGEEAGGVVTWTLENVGAREEGIATLTVEVLPGAEVPAEGSQIGSVINEGTTVQVGNDDAFTLKPVENPVPVKKETAPYEGTGVLGEVEVGDIITYEINYMNYKQEAATVVIRDPLDKNVEFVSADNGGIYNAKTHTVTWTITDVPAGESGKVTLQVKVLKGAMVPGKVVNEGATVKVGNDHEFTLETVTNPVPSVSVTVRKIWDDNNNTAGVRPVVLKVTLSNGSVYYLNEGNNWTVTVTGLPKYRNGELIVYTWSEQSIPGYTGTVEVQGDTTIFTNSYAAEKRKRTGPVTIDEPPTPLGLGTCFNHVGDNFE